MKAFGKTVRLSHTDLYHKMTNSVGWNTAHAVSMETFMTEPSATQVIERAVKGVLPDSEAGP